MGCKEKSVRVEEGEVFLKTIGLIGGMSWESSLEYYRIINETIRLNLGGLHSAQCLMYSVDFQEIERLQHQNNWDELTDIMVNCAYKLKKAVLILLLSVLIPCIKWPMILKKGWD